MTWKSVPDFGSSDIITVLVVNSSALSYRKVPFLALLVSRVETLTEMLLSESFIRLLNM